MMVRRYSLKVIDTILLCLTPNSIVKQKTRVYEFQDVFKTLFLLAYSLFFPSHFSSKVVAYEVIVSDDVFG